MKHLTLLVTVLFFAACSKETGYGPWNLQDGQEVEVLVSHRYGAIGDHLTLLPQNIPGQLHLYSFLDREPGYNYRVKARMVVPKVPAQDGPSYHLDFLKVINREKQEGNESFEIALIQSHVPGGPTIHLLKQNGHYYFVPEKLTLTGTTDEVESQLEEIWQHADQIRQSRQTDKTVPGLKWKAIKATVTHDQEKFGLSYLVSHIEFTE